MSGNGIVDVVPNFLPKSPVPVLMSCRYRHRCRAGTGTGTDLGTHTGGICPGHIYDSVFHGGTCLGSSSYAVQKVPFSSSTEKYIHIENGESPT